MNKKTRAPRVKTIQVHEPGALLRVVYPIIIDEPEALNKSARSYYTDVLLKDSVFVYLGKITGTGNASMIFFNGSAWVVDTYDIIAYTTAVD